jgi:hypothetical protein
MGRRRRRPAKEAIISAASLCAAAALPGCSSAGPPAADPPVPTTVHSTAHSTHPAKAALAFTVAGDRPVLPSGSRDTHTQTPNARCDSATFAADKALGARLARAFALADLPVSANLLAHFLTGKGTGVNYRAGPPMRYLQTVCGAPRHAGGAHWFPDTITVTVPFNRPA